MPSPGTGGIENGEGIDGTKRRSPAGTPIGPIFSVPIGRANDQLRRVLAAIDAVHGDGALPPIPVVRRPLPPGEQGGYDPRTREIVVSRFATAPALTLVHEIGHVLDHHALGQSRMLASATDRRLAPWRAAVETTRAVADIDRSLRMPWTEPEFVHHLNYVRRYEELWARSYTQYVVTRSGVSELVEQLDRQRGRRLGRVYLPYYWDHGDFVGVGEVIDGLLRRLGWTR